MSEKSHALPFGIDLRFCVTPSLTEEDQTFFEYMIINSSKLDTIFQTIYVTFYDGHGVDEDGTMIHNDNLSGKQMVVRVWCPDPIIAISKGTIDSFYEGLKAIYSEEIISLIQNFIKRNNGRKYKAKLGAFLLVDKL